MKPMKMLIFGLVTSLLAASPALADVRVTMQDGRVSIVAKDATVRQILTEWARVGQTKIVNVERVPGGPVTLELTNVTETQALEVLLRSLSGYITAPRAVGAANLSSFDRIIIMPTIAAARPAVTASAAPPPPVFQQPAPQFQQPVEDDQEDERPAVVPTGANGLPAGASVVPPQNRGPVFNTFPRALEVAPQGVLPGGIVPATGGGGVPQPVTYPSTPTAPFGGVAVPGMVAPAPPQQGQPGQPGQIQPGAPGQPVRRPGGR
jgi:hypothetical protein